MACADCAQPLVRRCTTTVAFVCAVSGCGRLHFEPGSGGSDGNTGDAKPPDACIGPPGSYQLVPNGGFETGTLSPWTDDAPTQGTASVVATAWSGSFGVQLTPAVTGFTGYSISQVVTVTGGVRYVLSAYLYTLLLNDGSEGIYLDNNDAVFEMDVASVAGQLGWQFVYGTFQPPSFLNAVTVRVVHDGQIAPNRYSWVDEIAVTPEAQFVPPCP